MHPGQQKENAEKVTFFPDFLVQKAESRVALQSQLPLGKRDASLPSFALSVPACTGGLKKASEENKAGAEGFPTHGPAVLKYEAGEAKSILPLPTYPLTAARSVHRAVQLLRAD